MIRCKLAANSEDSCGKFCCCLTCEEMNDCKIICQYVYEKTIKNPAECENAAAEDDKLMVLRYKISPIVQSIVSLTEQKKSLDAEEKKMRQALLEAMEKFDIKSFENEHVKMVYVAPTTKTTIDTKALKAEMPAVAERFSKTSNVAASVRITVK